MLLVPASVLTLGAGALYGPVIGTVVVSAASTTGCTLAFLSSRYLIRPLAEDRLNQNSLFQALQRRIPERGAKLVLLLRLTPLVPFGLLNYMCGELPPSLAMQACQTASGQAAEQFVLAITRSCATETVNPPDRSCTLTACTSCWIAAAAVAEARGRITHSAAASQRRAP